MSYLVLKWAVFYMEPSMLLLPSLPLKYAWTGVMRKPKGNENTTALSK